MAKSFINQNENDEFIKFRGLDLQELIVQVEQYYLEYRASLGLPDDLTFGVEIEYEYANRDSTDRFISNQMPAWTSKGDGSLNFGGEVTSPIMTDKLRFWRELKHVCSFLTEKGADTHHNAGGHIHVGTCALGDNVNAWRHFLKLYILYENVLFRFVYGDKINARRKIQHYAPPIADKLYNHLKQINQARRVDELQFILPTNRYQAINFNHVDFDSPTAKYNKNTIEFRSPNGTTNEIIWQNNINTVSKMLIAARQQVMDEDFLNYKLKSYENNPYLYNYISFKSVLEFVDLVFDNNLDKVYFLRQYFKDFRDSYGLTKTESSEIFVKK